ncbi:MAG: GNAT family N-acetyltransferase [Gammaproteobacteria bacterium]|jgi:GNAT superfamily N-acetyltransferase|nr:GNAT family N-acetyltransferase [Gammaproteobacteria bacterium]|tara:strand:- start:873 stop:1322 length:450 start_codon:yes stop_codon:yes gene_type:complete
MLIRDAEERDLPGILSLYAELNPDDAVVDDGRDSETFGKILSSDFLKLFVGMIDEQIISTCYLNIIPNLSRDVSPYGIVENVVTRHDLRNQGYGSAVFGHALRHAWGVGCYKVMLQTGSKRESTHNFYKSCGFSADDKFAFVARPPQHM